MAAVHNNEKVEDASLILNKDGYNTRHAIKIKDNSIANIVFHYLDESFFHEEQGNDAEVLDTDKKVAQKQIDPNTTLVVHTVSGVLFRLQVIVL